MSSVGQREQHCLYSKVPQSALIWLLPAGYQPGLKARKFLTDTINENLDLIKKDLHDSKCAPALLASCHSAE